jgi:hypothetical protein
MERFFELNNKDRNQRVIKMRREVFFLILYNWY